MANYRGAYKKKQENIENIYARYKLLVSIFENNEKVSKELIDALSGQRKFAAFNIKDTQIKPISLNTMKAIANEILVNESPNGNGFEYLDNLRTTLYQKTKSRGESRSLKAKIERKKECTEELKNALKQAELMNLQRSKAYLDIIRRIRELLSSGTTDDLTKLKLTSLMEDHDELYSHLLYPSSESGPDGLFIVIKGAQDDGE